MTPKSTDVAARMAVVHLKRALRAAPARADGPAVVAELSRQNRDDAFQPAARLGRAKMAQAADLAAPASPFTVTMWHQASVDTPVRSTRRPQHHDEMGPPTVTTFAGSDHERLHGSSQRCSPESPSKAAMRLASCAVRLSPPWWTLNVRSVETVELHDCVLPDAPHRW